MKDDEKGGYIESYGGRGRPLHISADQASSFLDALTRAARTLHEEIETTHGFRDPRVLGERGGSLPDYLEFARAVAMRAEQGERIVISREEAKRIREAMDVSRSLGAKQTTYREEALRRLQERDYLASLDLAQKSARTQIGQEAVSRITKVYKGRSKKEQRSFFRSRQYQDVRSAIGHIRDEDKRYKRVIEWVKSDIESRTGRKAPVHVSAEEALLYVVAVKAGSPEDVGL